MENVHIFKKYGKWILTENGAAIHSAADLDEIVDMVKAREPLPVAEVREYDSMEEAIKGEADLIAEED